MRELFTTSQTATYLGLSKSTLEHWRSIGRGPKVIRVGPRCIRYRLDDIDAWLNEQLINTH